MSEYPAGSEYCSLEGCYLHFHRDGTSGSRPVRVEINLTCVRLETGHEENQIVFYHSDLRLIAAISKVMRPPVEDDERS